MYIYDYWCYYYRCIPAEGSRDKSASGETSECRKEPLSHHKQWIPFYVRCYFSAVTSAVKFLSLLMP